MASSQGWKSHKCAYDSRHGAKWKGGLCFVSDSDVPCEALEGILSFSELWRSHSDTTTFVASTGTHFRYENFTTESE